MPGEVWFQWVLADIQLQDAGGMEPTAKSNPVVTKQLSTGGQRIVLKTYLSSLLPLIM